MFPPHTHGIKNGNKNIIEKTPKRERKLSFFSTLTKQLKPRENNALKVANSL